MNTTDSESTSEKDLDDIIEDEGNQGFNDNDE